MGQARRVLLLGAANAALGSVVNAFMGKIICFGSVSKLKKKIPIPAIEMLHFIFYIAFG